MTLGWLVFAAFAAADGAPLVRVDTARDAHLPCPANEALRAAIVDAAREARLADASASADLIASMQWRDERWFVVLSGADGAPALEREVTGSRDCAAVGAAAALIVDGFAGSASRAASPPRLEPLPPRPDTRALRGLFVGVGPSVRADAAEGSDLGGSVAVEARFWGLGWVGLGASAESAHTRTITIRGVDRGTLSSNAFSASVAAGACVPSGVEVTICGGPMVGVLGLRGEATGQVYRPAAQVVTTPEIGLAARLGLRVAGRLDVSLGGHAAFPLRTTWVEVEGTDARRSTGPFDGVLSLRVGWWIL